jgi:hypothetical protein
MGLEIGVKISLSNLIEKRKIKLIGKKLRGCSKNP